MKPQQAGKPRRPRRRSWTGMGHATPKDPTLLHLDLGLQATLINSPLLPLVFHTTRCHFPGDTVPFEG